MRSDELHLNIPSAVQRNTFLETVGTAVRVEFVNECFLIDRADAGVVFAVENQWRTHHPYRTKRAVHHGDGFDVQLQFHYLRDVIDIPDQIINNFAKNLDLSVGAGIGYHSRIGLGVGARYIAGLSKVGDFSGNNIDPDFKNSVIQASIFWAIPFKK